MVNSVVACSIRIHISKEREEEGVVITFQKGHSDSSYNQASTDKIQYNNNCEEG